MTTRSQPFTFKNAVNRCELTGAAHDLTGSQSFQTALNIHSKHLIPPRQYIVAGSVGLIALYGLLALAVPVMIPANAALAFANGALLFARVVLGDSADQAAAHLRYAWGWAALWQSFRPW